MFSLLKSSACLLVLILLWLSPSFRNRITKYFDRIEHFLTINKKAVVLTTFSVYIAVTIFLQFHHSLDGDEIQAWFIARDSESLGQMYSLMGYEGTPGLWHTLLFPLAKSGAPYQIMYFLNHLFVIIAIILWLRFAPFPLFVRLLFPFVHVFLTEYSVNARSYGLSICLLFTAMTLYKRSYNKWLLWSFSFFLFANTNLHSALLTCGLVLFLFLNRIFLKNKTDGKAMLLIGAGILFAAVQVYPPVDLARSLSEFRFQMSLVWIITPLISGASSLSIFIYLALLIQVMLSIKSRSAIYGLLSVQMALFFLFLFKYHGHLSHHFFLVLSILMFLWMGNIKENKRKVTYLFLFAIFFLMVTGAVRLSLDNVNHYYYDRSGQEKKEMADFINRTIHPDSTTFIACHPATTGEGMLPYLRIKSMFMPNENRWGSYGLWNRQGELANFNPYLIENVINLSRNHPGYTNYYFLTIFELPIDSMRYYNIELLKKTTNKYLLREGSMWSTYYFYKLPY